MLYECKGDIKCSSAQGVIHFGLCQCLSGCLHQRDREARGVRLKETGQSKPMSASSPLFHSFSVSLLSSCITDLFVCVRNCNECVHFQLRQFLLRECAGSSNVVLINIKAQSPAVMRSYTI
jgi:hypothetical protein